MKGHLFSSRREGPSIFRRGVEGLGAPQILLRRAELVETWRRELQDVPSGEARAPGRAARGGKDGEGGREPAAERAVGSGPHGLARP